MSIEHSPARSAKAGSVLDDYITKAELCADLDCHPRTIARYEKLPDGLPVTKIAGRNYYHVPSARAFVARRTRQPNPVRKAGS